MNIYRSILRQLMFMLDGVRNRLNNIYLSTYRKHPTDDS